MTTSILKRRPKNSIPLVPLTSEAYSDWLASQDAATKAWAKAGGFGARSGEILMLPGKDRSLSAIAFGYERGDILWSFAGLASRLNAGNYHIDAELPDDAAGVAVLGWLIGGYSFDRYKAKPDEGGAKLLAPKNADTALAEALAAATFTVRDLINTPANDMGPSSLAKAAQGLARRFDAKVKVIKGDGLLKSNFPLVHSVGRASSDAPRLIDLRWGKRGAKITLVGKGVCFDSGGLDLKSASNMLLMKKDMGGGAHVLGLAEAIMATGLAVRLRVLVPAVENAVAGNAFRPLDVLESRKGISVEIGNTDAEGRLILADALTLASEDKPDLLLDFGEP
ncbi:MAG: leucyl aminopeptidase family protein, partial [Kiloniellales bacterium]|nr:leucyl aminopeptidase family protein [Kiloniellales bacterium]